MLAPGLNVVVGDNAQGKTNLLEAISFAVTGSPRTPNDSEVVRWGQDFARTEARVSLDGGERAVAVGYAPGQKKRLTVDGAPAPSLTTYAAGGAGVRVVTFFPDDIRIVKEPRRPQGSSSTACSPPSARPTPGPPSSTPKPSSNATSSSGGSGTASPRRLSTWDRKVVELGETVLKGREAAIGPPRAYFGASLRALYGPRRPTYAIPIAHPRRVRRGAQRGSQRRHRTRHHLGRATPGRLRGPARRGGPDDLRLAGSAAPRDARAQVRRQGLREGDGEDPILLFDDVMSELDERRREYLAGYFLESTQAVITTTNLDYFDEEILEDPRRTYIWWCRLETTSGGVR